MNSAIAVALLAFLGFVARNSWRKRRSPEIVEPVEELEGVKPPWGYPQVPVEDPPRRDP
jgi:hypothetical protein